MSATVRRNVAAATLGIQATNAVNHVRGLSGRGLTYRRRQDRNNTIDTPNRNVAPADVKCSVLMEETVEAPAEMDPPAGYSGLMGKALEPKSYPTRPEVFAALPKHVYEKDDVKSLSYAIFSTALTLSLGVAAYMFIPLKLAFAPIWALYAVVTGTVATGSWVVAHECGHGAFSDNKKLQDTVGYILHSLLLVPYFSWQRSHAIHHSRTNHMSEGETHVPEEHDSIKGKIYYAMQESIGKTGYMIVNMVLHLVVGWPAYLLTGATGGTKYGLTNHFWPVKPFSDGLWPGDKLKEKVWLSDVGILGTLGLLAFWAVKAGSIMPVLAVYGAPYLVTNFWLVLYTWLQHTDVDVPHYADKEWDWVKGTFLTIDRPYPPVIDFLHHRIGTTHVAHHVSHTIPHYNAKEATNALKEAFPDLYLYDPTPIHKALFRIAKNCVAVKKDGDRYVFHNSRP